MSEAKEEFKLWAIVELMGHHKVAGYVTEQEIGGTNMLRVDIPKTDNQEAFTEFYSNKALYAIHPTSEKVAKAMANNLEVAPIQAWEIKPLITEEANRMLAASNAEEPEGCELDFD